MEDKQKEVLDLVKNEIREAVENIDTTQVDETIAGLKSEIDALKAEKNDTTKMTWKDAIEAAVSGDVEKIKGVGNGENLTGHKLVVKAAGTISSGNISGGDIPQAYRSAGVNDLPQRKIRFIGAMPSMTMVEDKYEYVYLANEDGAAGYTAEGSLKNQIDVDWVVGSEDVKKVTAFIKVTDEMLAKGTQVSAVIQRKLVDKVLQAVESEIYQGSNFTNLKGVASAFDATIADDGSASPAIENANFVDVLATAATQIEVAQEGDAEANAIFMHPADVLTLGKLKSKVASGDRRYVDRIIDSAQGLSVDGIRIIKSTLVTRGEYFIGDMTKALLVQREGMSVEFGFDGDDFTKNLRTIRAEWRGCLVVEQPDRSAFVSGVFATDIAALEALA